MPDFLTGLPFKLLSKLNHLTQRSPFNTLIMILLKALMAPHDPQDKNQASWCDTHSPSQSGLGSLYWNALLLFFPTYAAQGTSGAA